MLLNLSKFSLSVVESGYQHSSITAVILLSILLVVGYISSLTKKKPRLIPGVPFVGVENGKVGKADVARRFVSNSSDLLEEGYKMTGGGFFYVATPDTSRLMIPTKYIEELKNAPDDKADFLESFVEMFEGDYTTIGRRWNLHPPIVKGTLNPNLKTVLPPVEKEIAIAFDTIIPRCDDWTPIPIATVFRRIVAQASGRMIGGLTLSRNAEWLQTSLDFTTDSWAAAQKLKAYPFWAKPVIQWFLPEMANVRRHIKVAQKFINPLLREREKLSREKDKLAPVDLLQMLHDGARGRDSDHNFLAYTALAVSFAAIHTSASVPAHLVYDLCAKPEYIEPLREEVREVLMGDGALTLPALAKLVKMDSFMKESQRFNPLVFMTFGRVIHSDFTLSDGIAIPAGTIIGIPSHAIMQDPAFFENPSTFEGFRFVPPEDPESDTAVKRHLQPSFVTTNAANLAWGYGKHACSGRFFASYEIKMVMAYLLLHFDFKFEDGRTERPANVSFELQNSPDPTINILLKRRTDKTDFEW